MPQPGRAPRGGRPARHKLLDLLGDLALLGGTLAARVTHRAGHPAPCLRAGGGGGGTSTPRAFSTRSV
ncbi:MAG: UDP-3-O-acyl-N-acetylglucosamine deacetylase [bacterium]